MPSSRNTTAILAAAALAVGWLGCGGEEEPAPVQPPARNEVPRPKPPAPNIRSNVTVEEEDAEGNPVRFSGTDARGKEFSASIGASAAIPEDFPSDLAPYPGATTMATMSSAGEAMLVTYQSSDKQGDVYAFYKSQLEQGGWDIAEEKNFRGQLTIDATREARKVTVTIAGTAGDSRISVIVTDVQ